MNLPRIGSMKNMMTAITPKNSGADSLSAAVNGFGRLSSPAMVRETLLNQLNAFQNAPAAAEKLRDARDASGGNLLHHVASFESNEAAGFVPQLAGLGVDVNAPDKKGASPLFYAVARTVPSAVLISALLTVGADPNGQNLQTGKSVLVAAMMTRPPVDNLIALLEHPNTEIPAQITLSNGAKMPFDTLVSRTYTGGDLQRLQTILDQKKAPSDLEA
jgi:hypothetical protein